MRSVKSANAVQRFVACERGNVLVELGLVASLLMATVLGLFEFAAVTSQSSKLSSAARIAVEHAVKDPSDVTGIRNVAVQSGSLVDATLSVDVNMFCECPGSGSAGCADTCIDGTLSNMFVAVSLSQPAETLMQGGGLLKDLTLAQTATMRMR